MDLQGRLILWWLLLTRYAGFRQMPPSTGKLTQCLIQGDSPRKQHRQGRERNNVSITLLGIIKKKKKNGIQGGTWKLRAAWKKKTHCFSLLLHPPPKAREEVRVQKNEQRDPYGKTTFAQYLSCVCTRKPAPAKICLILYFLDGVPFDLLSI